jgi:hypothetical protein
MKINRLLLLSLLAILSCHNTKETDDSANQDTSCQLKRSAFTKATSTIDTVDYNKRIVALQ